MVNEKCKNIELDFTQRQLQSSLFDPIPLGNMKGPIFNTALIFAFKEIAEEKYMAASITLSKAGMLNYAAAAQLTSIFREGEDLRKEILTSSGIRLPACLGILHDTAGTALPHPPSG